MNTRDPIGHTEAQASSTSSKLNWLRAAVLGANDGIVSVSSVIVGVAGALNSKSYILTAGVAALVAGSLSMAVGEYVSVSTQRDTERALLEKERQELIDFPEKELEELAQIYKAKGLTTETAHKVAQELTDNDAFAAHVDAELGIDPDDLTNPVHAFFASGLSFICGGIIPVIAVIFAPTSIRIPLVFGSVVIALMITGGLSAHAGGANKQKATIRVVIGGLLAMAVTFGIGTLFGVAGI